MNKEKFVLIMIMDLNCPLKMTGFKRLMITMIGTIGTMTGMTMIGTTMIGTTMIGTTTTTGTMTTGTMTIIGTTKMTGRTMKMI